MFRITLTHLTGYFIWQAAAVTFFIGALTNLASAACLPNEIAVAAFAKHAEKKIVGAAKAKVSPTCNIVEIGLLAGVDSANLTPIGQPDNSSSGSVQLEMNALDPGTYWIAAYARDEEGVIIQSAPVPVHVMETSLPQEQALVATAAAPSYTGTDADFLQFVNDNHFASVKRMTRLGSIELTFFETLMIDQGNRYVANTSRTEVLAEQSQTIATRSTPVNFNANDIQNALNRNELFFSNFPRSGLYQVTCDYSLFPLLSSGCSDSFSDVFLQDTNILQVFTSNGGSPSTQKQVQSASLVYFIPATPSGKRFKEAKLRAQFTASGEQIGSIAQSILLNGVAPSESQIFSCNSGAFGFSQLLECRGVATWDFTSQVSSLVGGGGQLTVVAQLANQFSGTITTPDSTNTLTYKSLDVSPLSINYPWLQRGQNGSLAIVFEDACTRDLQIDLSPDSVSPRGPGLSNEQSNVEVKVTGCPSGGGGLASVVVALQIDPNKPVPGSPDGGGHNHTGVRPLGAFLSASGPKSTLCTAVLDSAGHGSCSVNYFPPEVGGRETIVARANDFTDAEKKITIRVPGLENLRNVNTNVFRFVGALAAHPDNHWGTLNTVNVIQLIALDFFEAFDATLGINDMSLQMGGMFEICPPFYDPRHTCPGISKGGHFTHRKGTSIDINLRACPGLTSNPFGSCSETVNVSKTFIAKSCSFRGRGFLMPESSIHCELPN